jgi:hypothetical protein
MSDLFTGYQTNIRPVFNVNTPINISLDLSLMQLLSVVSYRSTILTFKTFIKLCRFFLKPNLKNDEAETIQFSGWLILVKIK